MTVMNFESTSRTHSSLEQAGSGEKEMDESVVAEKIDIFDVLTADQLLIDFGA
jgi:hypothetical protein